MKPIIQILFLILSAIVAKGQPCITLSESCGDCGLTYCGPYELSHGVYRLPFVDGTEIEVVCDHLSHCPRGRVDMIGTDGDFSGEYHIAAAADGWIRAISDGHNVQCDCSTSSCDNNYVWMEHPDGEWTKYTHFKQNSVTNLGHFEGEWITAGTYLGNEGDVGCASGVHLHFECAQPVDTNTLLFDEGGGYIDPDWAKNVIPIFCGISGNVLVKGETYVAGDCPSSCNGFLVPFPLTFDAGDYEVVLNEDDISNSLDVTFEGYSSGLFQAGNSVTLNEGFEVKSNATFLARIADCDEFAQKLSEENQTTMDDFEIDDAFIVFPNPSSGLLTLKFKALPAGDCQIIIRNALGAIVQSKLTEDSSVMSFDLTSQPSGVYQVELSTGDKIYSKKIIVAR